MKDLIIDCFAGGGGASVGIEMALGRQVDIAINHDPYAILMHKTNHPNTLHKQESIWEVNPLEVTRGRKVGLLWASPDCTQFSKAKGSKPKKKENRLLPWAITMWARQVRPEVIIAENVEEIQDWGPLDGNSYPIPERRGETFRKFIQTLEASGYRAEWKELIAADYGARTTRNRWYMIARCDNREIVFPEQTHFNSGYPEWNPVFEVLNFSDLGKSIFERKKPLAENTLKRIAKGIKKFIIDNPNPYIIPGKYALPFLIQYHSETRGCDVRGQVVDEPIRTLDTSNRYGLVTAFITKYYKTGIGQGIDSPLHTITTSPGHFGLVSAFLIKYYGNGTGQSIDKPIGTIVTKDRFGLVLVVINGETYQISDIRLRMLKPEELKLAQGFPSDYIIDHDYTGKKYPISEQVARIGNSVVPVMAETLVSHNCGYLKLGERRLNMSIDNSGEQLSFVG